MTDHISDDLAALGRRARDRLPPVASTLERLSPGAELTGDRAMVVLSRAFCDRVARGAAGGTGLALMVGLVGYLAFPHDGHDPRDSWVSALIDTRLFMVGGIALMVVLAVYWAAGRIAERSFDRVVVGGDALARARALVDRWAPWSLGLAVAGAMAYVLVFGSLHVMLDNRSLQDLSWTSADPLRHDASVLLPALIAAAIASGALVVRGFVPDRPSAIIIGTVLLLITMALGLQFDSGVLGPTLRHATYERRMFWPLPQVDAVRIALTCAGTVAVYLIVGSAFARRHRREVAGL